MSINNHFLQPPLNISVKPMKLSSPLKQAGINSLSHKSLAKSILHSTEDQDTESNYNSEDLNKILNPPLSYTVKRNNELLETSTNYSNFKNYSVPESPHFFLRHESKSELKFNRKIEFPKHISPVPLADNEFWSNTPSASRNRFGMASSPMPATCKSGYLPRLDKTGITSLSRKMVIIDLDETLIHSSPMNKLPDHIITKILPDGSSICFKVSIRPYAKEFLRTVSTLADTVIFTASVKNYADSIIELLDPNREYIKQRYYRDSCTMTNHGYVKDLSIFNRPLKDLLIIDNLASSFSKQKENGILISSWYGDKKDKELFKLCKNISKILSYDDLRKSDKNFQVIH